MSRKKSDEDAVPEEQCEQSSEELSKLMNQLEEKDSIIKDYLDTMQLLQADFENYKKRVERERASTALCAKESILVKLLEISDNFERALSLLPAEKERTDFEKGVEMIYGQLLRLYEEEGVKVIDCVNKEFDPYLHEALFMDGDSKGTIDVVCEEFQKGYKLNEKVIRHSKVKVKKSESIDEGEQNE